MTKQLSAEAVKQMISYFYLVAYGPPEHIGQLESTSKPMRTALAKGEGLRAKAFRTAAAGEAAFRIVAYHQATREPEKAVVENLAGKMQAADSSPQAAAAYQALMEQVARLPGRAKPDRRLHRKKGCTLCVAPCQYGFFTLISDPVFTNLLAMLNAENKKPGGQRDPVKVLWSFTTTHLWGVLAEKEGFIRADHLGNLAFCLLLLATAKSRYPFPEQQLSAFQALNQRVIQNWKPMQIDVRGPV